ncbi:MAG: hypothetical protein ACOYML_07850 [Microthrixaceae bacterium]
MSGVGASERRAVLRRPDLWATAIRQAFRLAPRGWWRRPPFLPLPAGSYLRFRMVTAYGGDGEPGHEQGDGDIDRAGDLITYLEWCRAWPHLAHRADTASTPS